MEELEAAPETSTRGPLDVVRRILFHAVFAATLGALLVLLAALTYYHLGYRPQQAESLTPDVTRWAAAGVAAPEKDTVRVLSINLNHGAPSFFDVEHGEVQTLQASGISQRLDALADAVSRENVDVVALQGVDFRCDFSGSMDQADYLASKLKFGYVVKARTWKHPFLPFPRPLDRITLGEVDTGLAILSRLPLQEAERFALPPETLEDWWQTTFAPQPAVLKAQVSSRGRHLVIYTTELTSGSVGARENQARAAGKVVADTSGGRGLLVGTLFAEPALRREGDASRMDVSYNLLRSRRNFAPSFRDWEYFKDPAAFATFTAADGARRLADYVLPERSIRVTKRFTPALASPISPHDPQIVELVL
jgi:endonuclease/exonuclease/phosphatase family metal-dependent hydrolase